MRASSPLSPLRARRGALVRGEVNWSLSSYECVFILRADLGEEPTEEAIQRVLTQIADLGGTVESVDRWGKRRLAYEIDDQREGVYTVVRLHAQPGQTAELERNFRLAGDVLRHLIVRVES